MANLPEPIVIANPFSIRLFLLEKVHMRQRLVFLLGAEVAESVINSRVPFILPEVTHGPPSWTCTIFILY